MNIFISDTTPERAAKNLDDKRVVKMILESTQILCTAINYYGSTAPYRSTHINHPANIWTRQTRQNWLWLWNHAYELCDRYQAAYNKVHKCRDILINLVDDRLEQVLPEGELTPFINCTTNKEKGISFKHIEDTVIAYRHYLIARWNTDTLTPKWTKRTLPAWLGLDKDNKYCYIPIND